MLDSIWGYTYMPATRRVDTHIWRLRKKLGDDGEEPRWIKKAPSAGYVMELETRET
jgi:two-component system response regulator MprA